LADVKPSMAGPRLPQDRVLLSDIKANYRENFKDLTKQRDDQLERFMDEGGSTAVGRKESNAAEAGDVCKTPDSCNKLGDGSVVIAAITSCTNTSNPAVMIAAALIASKAADKVLSVKPWVKT